MSKKLSRRHFLASASTLAATAATTGFRPLAGDAGAPTSNQTSGYNVAGINAAPILSNKALDLSPAKWIWYPAKRILPNTFFHFRKTFDVKQEIKSAKGWIVGDSRYVLFCNGRRIQFGPAPADPRFTEADPVDLSELLQKGENTIGATVLYYGFGDGTWPAGKAGFIFRLDLEYADGSKEMLVSDKNWKVQLARSWPAGMYKRWYLRSLQEVFDNRLYPFGWNEKNFTEDGS